MNNNLTSDEYFNLLTGKCKGKNYSSTYFYVKREKKKKNPIQNDILLQANMGLPQNLNPDYQTKIETNKRVKKRKIDPEVLRTILQNRN